jgi:hypothetical protein
MHVKLNTLLWIVAGLLLAAVSAVAVYKTWPVMFPKVHTAAPLNPACDLRAGPCTSPLPAGASITFAIEPRSIPVVQPLQLRVDLVGLQAQGVQIDFRGVDMNMGFNRPTLQAQGAGHYAGEGRLPVCVRDAMQWEARVLVQTDEGLISAPYRFITVKPGMQPPE